MTGFSQRSLSFCSRCLTGSQARVRVSTSVVGSSVSAARWMTPIASAASQNWIRSAPSTSSAE